MVHKGCTTRYQGVGQEVFLKKKKKDKLKTKTKLDPHVEKKWPEKKILTHMEKK